MIMSEILKNIETCRGEDVLAEVSALPQDPHFGSLVNEALDPLKQQALHQAGYDGYSEVIAQHKPYTFASAIIQMKSNLLLLLRALWQFPFGAGTLRSLSDDASLRSLSEDASLRSLSDMWQHYITRLQGNETYGIPSRLSSLTDLPSAPLLVADRKMDAGIDIADGISMAQVLLSSDRANAVTEITDSTTGWTWDKPLNQFPNANKVTLGCKTMANMGGLYTKSDGEIHLPDCEYANQNNNTDSPIRAEKIYLEGFKYGWFRLSGSSSWSNTVTKYLYLGCKGTPEQTISIYNYHYDTSETHYGVAVEDIEIPQGARQGLMISNSTIVWWPALTRENVRAHIIDRLADNTDGVTLTIQLGTIRSKLTAEDIAVATAKNYNIAAF
jgi:hypothetical protein